MYFSLIPDIEYAQSPIRYPFSESDFVIAKNFFRRYQVDPNIFEYSVFFNKYAVLDGERIEGLAAAFYGDQFLDWIIILTNNLINPLFDFPLDANTLRKYAEKKYGEDECYSGIHHYETTGYTNNEGTVLLESGLIVDENFYQSTHNFYNINGFVTVPGILLSRSVTNFEYETAENEKKREIYILRPDLVENFVNDFKKNNLYQESDDFISKRLKKSSRF